jgi:HSP20 family protein
MRLIRWQRPEMPSWNTFDQLTSLRDEINRLFELPTSGLNRESEFFGWAPAVDLYEDNDHLIVQAELPGMKKEEIEVSLHNENLVISGERRAESEHDGSEPSRLERFFGRFQRSLTLPKPVDPATVSASYKDGILTVTLPKTEESKPKQITVKAS